MARSLDNFRMRAVQPIAPSHSGNCTQLFQDRFGTDAPVASQFAPVASQFAPAHDALAANDKHCRTGDVAAIDTRVTVKLT